MNITEAKNRLDRLISKARVHFYKPIQIAEILYRDRLQKDIDLSDINTYRRQSTRWRNEICPRLVGKTPVLNSRYEDQLFDKGLIPPEVMVQLGKENKKKEFPGAVESYIYRKLQERISPLTEILRVLETINPPNFNLQSFLDYFEKDKKLCRSIDKIYEIIVYALFDTLAKHLDATVTLKITKSKKTILIDFEKFAKIVLGIDRDNLSITQPARLYRFGITNAADTGLDIWANFGPAIQVKHIAIDNPAISEINEKISADKIVIVCKTADQNIIENIIKQFGISERVRGFITEKDLLAWYQKVFSRKYANSIGKDTLKSLIKEFKLEFPLTMSEDITKFFEERGYAKYGKDSIWAT